MDEYTDILPGICQMKCFKFAGSGFGAVWIRLLHHWISYHQGARGVIPSIIGVHRGA
jgi:hypothetical protein